MGKQYNKRKNVVVDNDKDTFVERKDYRRKKIDVNKLRNKNHRQAHSYIKPTEMRAGGEFEYKMSKASIIDLLKNRKGPDRNKDAQKFLCDYVNEEFGLLGSCVRVISF